MRGLFHDPNNARMLRPIALPVNEVLVNLAEDGDGCLGYCRNLTCFSVSLCVLSVSVVKIAERRIHHRVTENSLRHQEMKSGHYLVFTILDIFLLAVDTVTCWSEYHRTCLACARFGSK